MGDDEVELVPGVMGPRVVPGDDVLHVVPGNQQVTFVHVFDDLERRYVCDELTVRRGSGQPVTTEALRNVQVDQMASVRLLGKGVLRDVPNPDGREPWGRVWPEGLAAEGATDRVLRWVAHVYRLAYAIRIPPTKAVEDSLGLSRATTGRWVAQARRKGFLGPAEVGKAGG